MYWHRICVCTNQSMESNNAHSNAVTWNNLSIRIDAHNFFRKIKKQNGNVQPTNILSGRINSFNFVIGGKMIHKSYSSFKQWNIYYSLYSNHWGSLKIHQNDRWGILRDLWVSSQRLRRASFVTAAILMDPFDTVTNFKSCACHPAALLTTFRFKFAVRCK